MKKITLLFALLYSFSFFSHCVIKGKDKPKINQVEIYTIENDQSQCEDCYLWKNDEK